MQNLEWIKWSAISTVAMILVACGGGGGGGDTVKPDIYLSGMITISINCGNSYTPPTVSAIDDVDGSVVVTQTGSIDTNHAGVQTVTYSAQDSAGNVGTYDLNVEVKTFSHNGIEYCTVKSPYTNDIWLDRNLGSSKQCTAYDDTDCYGDYYQWGREADGHEKLVHTTITALATGIDPIMPEGVRGNFIKATAVPNDWVATGIDRAGTIRAANWSSLVCPSGYRIPTIDELKDELTNPNSAEIQLNAAQKEGNSDDCRVNAYNSFLGLPTSGFINYADGVIFSTGLATNFWTIDTIGNNSKYLGWRNDAEYISDTARAYGFPVRCIKE